VLFVGLLFLRRSPLVLLGHNKSLFVSTRRRPFVLLLVPSARRLRSS